MEKTGPLKTIKWDRPGQYLFLKCPHTEPKPQGSNFSCDFYKLHWFRFHCITYFHVFLFRLVITKWQWHPFTISSAPGNSTVSVHTLLLFHEIREQFSDSRYHSLEPVTLPKGGHPKCGRRYLDGPIAALPEGDGPSREQQPLQGVLARCIPPVPSGPSILSLQGVPTD